MPNIVYVLTNPTMPGLLKIGMTDQPDVQDRMRQLYSTGVPLPFECVAAREVDSMSAGELEGALHTAFDPHRINPSREFFEMDPNRVLAILRILPGRDVTPGGGMEEDTPALDAYKSRKSRTNADEFLEPLSDNARRIYERVLALGNHDRIRIHWTLKAFTIRVVANVGDIAVGYGNPASSFNAALHTDFAYLESPGRVPVEDINALRQLALATSLFQPIGKGKNLGLQTDRWLSDEQLSALTGWWEAVAAKIHEHDIPAPEVV